MFRYQLVRRAVVAGLLIFLAIILIFGRSVQPEIIHDRIQTYGVVLIMLGIGGRLWSILYIGGRKSREIVKAGPYSITRNPLYLFSSIAAAGVGAQMGSYVATLGLAVLCTAAFHIVIMREERYLLERMGVSYAHYLAEVPRFFPNVRLYTGQKNVSFKPEVLRNTLLDGLLFFISIPFFELVEVGQTKGLIPVLFSLF
jgi:protein-S-isoprenylcysteine O-methyltransferase Ste14